MNKTLLILLFCTIVIGACVNTKQQEQELQKQVIAKHDTIMKKMDIVLLNKSKIDSIIKNPNQNTATQNQNLIKSKTDLAAADDAMMDWMNKFNPDYSGKSHREIMDYIKDQKIKIDSIETLFNKTILNSNALIAQY